MLSYLFTAVFRDGSCVAQTPEDVSAIDPTRSAFYDVAQRLDDVLLFAVKNASHLYEVELGTGNSTIDGIEFHAGDPSVQLPTDTKYRLVYFRRHTHPFNPQYEEQAHTIEYHIG